MAKGEPASSNVVMPLERDSSMARSDGLVGFGEAVGGGAFGLVVGAGAADHALRAFAEEAGGFAVGVLENFSAGGIRVSDR